MVTTRSVKSRMSPRTCSSFCRPMASMAPSRDACAPSVRFILSNASLMIAPPLNLHHEVQGIVDEGARRRAKRQSDDPGQKYRTEHFPADRTESSGQPGAGD